MDKSDKDKCAIHNVSVRYFYKGECTLDNCANCGGRNIKTYTSDWLRIQGINRKDCQNCNHYWLVNAR